MNRLAAVAALAAFAAPARAAAGLAPGTPVWAEGADVVEHIGARVPLDLGFVDAQGKPAPLRALFDGVHPVLLVLAYYECPQLCSLVLDSTTTAIRRLADQGFRAGSEYRVATVSFDAGERFEQAARRQTSVLARLGEPPAAWPFLVGDHASVEALTRALGFAFVRDPATGALAHAAVVFVLTPDGTIARYLYGVDYPARDLKLALLEAAGGKVGSIGDRLLVRCFRYDPATRRYGPFVAQFMKLGGALVVLVVLAVLAGFARLGRRRRGEGQRT